jgi:hypothetical protein
MASNVFILGAGASAAAGIPTMDKFLDRARDLMEGNQVGRAKAAFDLVFGAIDVLPQAHSKATLDIDNVESVFSALEMARIIGVFGDYSAEQIAQLDEAMRSVIATTIEKSMVIPISGKRTMPPEPYYDFALLIHRITTIHPRHQAAMITFNYDLAADYACHFVSLPVSYGFAEDDPTDGLPLLKLHGSLNWAECGHCNDIVPWRLHKYLQNYGWHDLNLVKSVRLELTHHLSQFSHHNYVAKSVPVVVPPTWGKASQHLRLSKVWHRAARALQSAENIFIVGYSLPPSDAFFKYLYAVGTIGKTRIRRFWVFNPDETVDARFRELLGQSVQGRYQFFPQRFDEAIKVIEEQFPAE